MIETYRAAFKCDKEDFAVFEHSTFLLNISVGQEIHESGKFLTTIGLLNKHFKRGGTILIDDSVQRHTMKLNSNKSEQELYDLSVLEGDRWILRNKKYYEQLNMDYEIVRWDKWLFHPKYECKRKMIRDAYNHNLHYRTSINKAIDVFLARYLKRDLEVNISNEEAFDLCLNYLVEECAIFCLWVEGGYNFEVYPGKRNLAFCATYEMFVQPSYPHLLKPVSIKFKNRKQLKPQRFSNEEVPSEIIIGTA